MENWYKEKYPLRNIVVSFGASGESTNCHSGVVTFKLEPHD